MINLPSLGKDAVIRNFVLGLVLITYAINALYISKIVIFATVYRVSYHTNFDSNLLFSPSADAALLASLTTILLLRYHRREILTYLTLGPMWLALIFVMLNYNDVANGIFMIFVSFALARLTILPFFANKVPLFYSAKYPTYKKHLWIAIMPLTFLELAALLTWFVYPILPTEIYGNEWWHFANLEADLFYAFGRLSLFLILLTIASFAVRYLLANIRQNTNRSFQQIASYIKNFVSDQDVIEFFSDKNKKAMLIGAIVLSSFVIFLPYLPTINSDGTPISTDIPIYVELLNLLEQEKEGEGSTDYSKIITGAFTEIAGGDRAFSLLILYTLKTLLPIDLLTILKFLPMALGPITVVTIYKLVRAYSTKYASIAALFTLFSFQMVAGIYAGFYANWIALVVYYVVLLLVVKYMDRYSVLFFSLLLVSSVSILFIHIYTWGVMVATLSTFAILQVIDAVKTRNKILFKGLMMILVVIAVNIASDVMRSYLIDVKGGITKDAELLGELGGWQEFAIRWSNLNYLFSIYLGGSMINSAMLIFALYASLTLPWRNRFSKILLATLYGSMIPILFGNYTLQARIIFDLPIHILGAIGFVDVINRLYSKYGGVYASSSVFVLTILHFANYLLRNLFNLFFKLS